MALKGKLPAGLCLSIIGTEGLTFTRSDVVRLDSEELTVSRDRISVSYRFTNTSARDVETIVAFPLPDQSFDVEVPVIDYAEQLAFRTTVDGEPVPLDVIVRASFAGRDITDRRASPSTTSSTRR